MDVLWQDPYALLAAAITLLLVICVFLGVRYDRRKQQQSTEGIENEPLEVKPVFENLHNFRQAGGTNLHNRYGQRVRDGLLFRSSRTDFLTDDESDQFLELGIKAIIDLRRNEEYVKAGGQKNLDKFYQPCIMKGGKVKEWRGPRRSKQSSGKDISSNRSKRYLINLMTMKLVRHVIGHVNFFIRYTSLVLLVVDWFFNCHLFVRLYSHLVSNHQTLAEQYLTMMEHTKPEIASIMRLLLKEGSVPVLIHCAHGKDRTGVIVAMVLGCLEVEDEIIAQDYSLSEAGLAPMKQRLFRETVGAFGFKKEFAKATIGTMREMLAEITRRYGGIPGYLSSAGFTTEEQQALKDIFLE